MAVTEQKTHVGQPVARKEDATLLQGQGRYVDNITVPGMVWAVLVRSPHAHARIKRVDVSKALAAEGVVAAFTGADLKDSWGSLPCFWPVSDDIKMPPHLPLAVDKAREPGAPLVHDDVPSNRCYTWALVAGEVDKAFAEAAVTVSERYRQQRLIPNAIEPRGVLCEISPATEDITVITSTQAPHILRTAYTLVLGIPEAKIRVIAPDVGGGFGSKVDVYAEDMVVITVARRPGPPVKWIEERSEAYLATIHGRDVVQQIELAATAEGKITAVRTRLTAAMGAYLQAVTPGVPLLGAWLYGGAYDPVAYDFHCTGVFTNTTPTDAYRGAGRPEATYAIERAIEALARQVGKDPVEIRRLNFMQGFPHTMASGLTVDAGDFDAALDRGLQVLGYAQVRTDQAERRGPGGTKKP